MRIRDWSSDVCSYDLDSPGLGVPLVEQFPFIERIISDFAANADFLAAYLVGRSGDSFVASSGAAAFSDAQRALALDSIERGQTVFGPARSIPAGRVIDLAVPKIGRASCRETGCQCVQFPVVSVQ